MSQRGANIPAPEAAGSDKADPPQPTSSDPDGATQQQQNAGDRVLEKAREDLLTAIDSGALQRGRPESSLTVGSRESRLSVSETGSIFSNISRYSSTSSRSSYASSIFSRTSSRLSRASSTLSLANWRSRTDLSADLPPLPTPAAAAAALLKRSPPVVVVPAANHWCTTCDEAFCTKDEWKQHEKNDHSSPNMLMCPKPGCCKIFWDVRAFRAHHELLHRCADCPHSNTRIELLGQSKHWACGFCSTVYHSREIQLEHIASHFSRGSTLKDWSHTKVIRGLLQQPQVQKYFAWRSKTFWEERVWDREATGRLGHFVHYSRPGKLQDMLEHFSGTDADADELVDLAIDLSRRDIAYIGLTETLQKYGARKLPLLPSNRQVSEILDSSSPRNSLSSSEEVAVASSSASKAEEPSYKSRELRRPSETSSTRSRGHVNFSLPGAYKRRASSASEASWNSAGRPKHKRNKAQLFGDNFMVVREHAAASEMRQGKDDRVREKRLTRLFDVEALPSPEPRVLESVIDLDLELRSYQTSCSSDMEDAISDESSSDGESLISLIDIDLSSTDGEAESRKQAVAAQTLDDSLEAMIDRVMEEFWVMWQQEWNAPTRKHNDGSTPSGTPDRAPGGSACASSTNNASGSTPPQKGKRRRSDDGSGNDDNDGQEGQPSRTPLPKESPPPGRKFACPYRKHDPAKYSLAARKVCAVSGWDSIARIKEHLYRCHRPIYCDRCKTVFKDSDGLKNHLLVDKADICDTTDAPVPEGITPNQVKQLRSRKKTARVQSEEDKWCNIYSLLFPNEPFPSPYFEPIEEAGRMSPESRELEQFEGYLHSEVPVLVRNRLMATARQEMGPIEQRLLHDLRQVIQDSIELASRRFREERGEQRHSPPPPPPPPPPPIERSPEESVPTGNEVESEALTDGPTVASEEEQLAESVVPGTTLVENFYGPQALDGLESESWRDFDLAQFLETQFVPEMSDSGYASGYNICHCPIQGCVCGTGFPDAWAM